MKQGNQFYLETQIFDSEDNELNINIVKKVQFNIGKTTKTYDGVSDEVTYDSQSKIFKIWITEEESFEFENQIGIEARVLFENDTIEGSVITSFFVYESLNKVTLDD